MRNSLFLSPNKPSTSLQQRFIVNYAEGIVTDFEHHACMNYNEIRWTAFVKNGLLDLSSYYSTAQAP